MPWRLVICRASASLLGVALLCSSTHIIALDTSRLWLAQTHQKYYLDLVRAARGAEALDRCESVLAGTLDREQSQVDHPYFRILCRQENGVSYNEMVDGLTFETLTTVVIDPPPLTEEEKERLRIEAEARAKLALEERKSIAWGECTSQLQQQTQMMMNLVVLTQSQPEPSMLSDTAIVFVTDFDAKDTWGKNLQYKAVCTVEDEGAVSTELSKR